jgi:large subunit ribosomal protein L20
VRVKRGVTTHKKHAKVRSATKGMTHSRRRSYKMGKQGVIKALQYSYRDRRNKKRTFRTLWNTRINAAAHLNGTTYSALINGLKVAKIDLDRKVLAELAVSEPAAFAEVVKKATK